MKVLPSRSDPRQFYADHSISAQINFDDAGRMLSLTHQRQQVANSTQVAYGYNSANQRSSMTQPDGTQWSWNYDALGQVAGANLQRTSDGALVPGRQYAYAYDGIGNRLQASRGDATDPASHPETATYTPTAENNYSSIAHTGTVSAAGYADPAAAVTVNGNAAQRLDSWYHLFLSAPNTGPQATSVPLTVTSVLAGNTTTLTQNAVLLPGSEFPQYDGFGRITQDAKWTYSWELDDRLGSVSGKVVRPDGFRTGLSFAYDSEGRRIGKRVWKIGWGNMWTMETETLYGGVETRSRDKEWGFVSPSGKSNNGGN